MIPLTIILATKSRTRNPLPKTRIAARIYGPVIRYLIRWVFFGLAAVTQFRHTFPTTSSDATAQVMGGRCEGVYEKIAAPLLDHEVIPFPVALDAVRRAEAKDVTLFADFGPRVECSVIHDCGK